MNVWLLMLPLVNIICAECIVFVLWRRSGIWHERILKLKCSPKVFQSLLKKNNKKKNSLTHLRHINIIPRPHQNPFQTESLSRSLSGKPQRSTKCIEEPLPKYRSIFFVISRAWWNKSVSKRFKGKAVSLSVSPVSHFEGLGLFFLFLPLRWGWKSGLLIPRAQREAAAIQKAGPNVHSFIHSLYQSENWRLHC